MENICEWYKCKNKGKYKAPIEKDNSKRFKWLCKEHIATFNKQWDYFANMTQNEIENFLKSDATWHRPTQKFGSLDNFFSMLWSNALDDKFKIFYEKENSNANIRSNLSTKDREAFKTMGLKLSDNWVTIQKQFKSLVKKFHPDKNPGNKMFEDHLKKITMAYSHLRSMMKSNKV